MLRGCRRPDNSRCRVLPPGGPQEQLFLELELVPTWLLMINTRTSTESMREKLRHFQRSIIREVYAAFGRLTGLPETSRQIEDLDELRRVDVALTALAERQPSRKARSRHAGRGAPSPEKSERLPPGWHHWSRSSGEPSPVSNAAIAISWYRHGARRPRRPTSGSGGVRTQQGGPAARQASGVPYGEKMSRRASERLISRRPVGSIHHT